MSDCKCENCGHTCHCGAECNECVNDVCVQCKCKHCNNKARYIQQEWAWQDSGIEMGF